MRHIMWMTGLGGMVGLVLAMPLSANQAASKEEIFKVAADGSRKLAALAEAAPEKEKDMAFCVEPCVKSDGQNIEARRFPRASHVEGYTWARPWSLAYMPMYQRDYTKAVPRAWPRMIHRDYLRNCLKDADSARRGLAAKALATLYQPEDLPLLAGLLGDNAESVPVLVKKVRADPYPHLSAVPLLAPD